MASLTPPPPKFATTQRQMLPAEVGRMHRDTARRPSASVVDEAGGRCANAVFPKISLRRAAALAFLSLLCDKALLSGGEPGQ
mmetsp:Transcript_11357/g.26146  ORF Transcript_11357/g.26146 Transcript_11357/m.26146 type:complete len:82 (-) Transcript_11357:1136-1381(-)